MSRYQLNFSHIGRTHDLSTVVEAADADAIAEAVFRFARKYLASRDYEVTVNLETMTGAIGYGRFGDFTIHDLGEA